MKKVGDAYYSFSEILTCGASTVPLIGDEFNPSCTSLKKRTMWFQLQQDGLKFKCKAKVRYNGRIESMDCKQVDDCDLVTEEIRDGYFGRYIKPH